ncbi:MAG TPA: endonuclease Q family protein [Candidatus Nanoarchaeia archaeon]|nr:endonuclease Q family protein [Candidatus Nanoarchaeia archaeon]
MEIIADLQIHSKYARATSKNLSLELLEKYARMKGLNLLGVGDFQHPLRRKEIDEKLTEDEYGILRTANGFPFLWQTEISLMYSQDGKRRAIHHLIFAPNREIADQITEFLGSKGRLDYDGRPIFGMSSPELVEALKKISDKIEIIPAHCMTPWFGLFGSKSGFDFLKECFQEQTRKIYAIESGMSADPSMLWRFKEVSEGVNVVSFSDAHSFWPWRLGREATIFEIPEFTYENIIKAIRTGHGLKATIETPPEYGKYHWDGHRLCGFSCSPEKTKELKGICPVCKKPLTIGVDNRVEEIAAFPQGHKPKNAKQFYRLLPLHEVIALSENSNLESNKTWQVYNKLIGEFTNEFNILLNASKEMLLGKGFDAKLVELILKNREEKIKVSPGYDGEYGKALLGEKQGTLI